jgi:transposase
VLAGTATGVPKTADGTSEVIREIKVVRDTAVKCRTQAIITLKTLVVTAPDELRHELQPLSKAKLRDRCAGLRPGKIDTPLAAAKHALKALARRWQHLDEEIKTHDRLLDGLTAQVAPALREAFGIGVDVAAEMLILARDNPERIRSEAAFAKLCGACPIPASSGATQRHRLNWGGHRQANSALYRSVIVRMRFHPTHHRICHQTHPRRQDQARNHPLPQAIPRPRDLPHNHPIPPRHHAPARPTKTRPKCLLTTIGASMLKSATWSVTKDLSLHSP